MPILLRCQLRRLLQGCIAPRCFCIVGMRLMMPVLLSMSLVEMLLTARLVDALRRQEAASFRGCSTRF